MIDIFVLEFGAAFAGSLVAIWITLGILWRLDAHRSNKSSY